MNDRETENGNMTLRYIALMSVFMGLAACSGSETSSKPEQPQISNSQKIADLTPLERGERIYKRCIACHTLGEGEKHKVGPNLYSIFGATAGAKEDFNYSKAMKASEIVWSDKTLDAYLTRPRDYIPGNRMSFIGLKKEEDRAAVIAYMKENTQ